MHSGIVYFYLMFWCSQLMTSLMTSVRPRCRTASECARRSRVYNCWNSNDSSQLTSTCPDCAASRSQRFSSSPRSRLRSGFRIAASSTRRSCWWKMAAEIWAEMNAVTAHVKRELVGNSVRQRCRWPVTLLIGYRPWQWHNKKLSYRRETARQLHT